MRMFDCPKFNACSAPICPLDPDWRDRSHLDGERVCHYLTVYSKSTVKPLFWEGQAVELYKAIADHYSEILALHPPINRQLLRSGKNSSKCNAPVRLEA
jgi:hypothetical protein